MKEKKIEEKNEIVKEEKKKGVYKPVPMLSIEDFIEDNKYTSMANSGFKMWYKFTKKLSILQRKPKEYWEKLYEEYKNHKV